MKGFTSDVFRGKKDGKLAKAMVRTFSDFEVVAPNTSPTSRFACRIGLPVYSYTIARIVRRAQHFWRRAFNSCLWSPSIAATVLLGRQLAKFGRYRTHKFFGDSFPAPEKFVLSESLWLSLRDALRDGTGWNGLLYAGVSVPLGFINFFITFALWLISISFTLTLAIIWFIPRGTSNGFVWVTQPDAWARVSEILHSASIRWHDLTNMATFAWGLGFTVTGLIFLAITPRIINLLATIDRQLVRVLCSPSAQALLHRRVNELEESRSASVHGAQSELRRIERDLHDGAQQHLVSVAMQLGLAKERINENTDPQIAELVTSAHKDAKQAIVDLRDLVRGIHPTVLTDRGLDAAVSALAARCPVPIEVKNEIELLSKYSTTESRVLTVLPRVG